MNAPLRGRGRPRGGAQQTEQTRARIRAAAIELFAAKGFHGTGVAEIGHRAGLRPGALYYHIGSKEELLWEVLRVHVEEAREAAEAVRAADLAPEEKLRELIRRQVATIATHRDEVAIYSRERDTLTGERAAQLQALRARVEAAWVDVCSSLPGADHVIVNGLLGLVNYVHLWYRPDGPDTPEQIADKYSDMVLRGLLRCPSI
jgi:AcrR family transcriptional regulator